jgi:DNA-binding transcriptional LysR family regulator
MVPNLDIDLLRTFSAVADCGSFTRAAEIVSRTQSAVSLQVKRLEEAVGRRLLERTSRSLALTPAGATLLGYARRMLELNDESVRRVAEPPMQGIFRLGITEYFVPAELPRLLARFGAAYPGVQLEVRMGLSSELREALRAGGLDAAVVRLGTREVDKALWKEPLKWVAAEAFEGSADEPLPLVLLPEPCVLRQHAIDSMKHAKRAWRIAFTGSSMASVRAAVAAGLGASIIPRSSIMPGMRVLSGSPHRDPGPLHVGLVRAPAARKDIVEVLDGVMRQTLDVIAVRKGS